MKFFCITYHAPYSFANFACEAATIEEARKLLADYNKAQSFCIADREIKSVEFDYKKIRFSQ